MINFIEQFDYNLSRSLLEHMNNLPFANKLISKIANANEVKGLVSAIIFWFLWFYPSKGDGRHRSKLWAVLFTTVVSITLGRILANSLPFRPRPRANPEVVGSAISQNSFFEDWSSMPSDHAIMFFALATGFFLISRKVGLLAFAHAALIVCLPRLLLGLHYLSDILVGAAIGVMLSILLVPLVSRVLDARFNQDRYPDYLVYPFLFFVTYSFATMFDGISEFGGIAKNFIKQIL